MFASSHLYPHPISWTSTVRWCARVSGVVLALGWASYAVAELFNPDFYFPPSLMFQGAALAIVFAGYAVAWRWELAGGLMAIAGTVAFVVCSMAAIGAMPLPHVAWFAAPGVLSVLAWSRGEKQSVI